MDRKDALVALCCQKCAKMYLVLLTIYTELLHCTYTEININEIYSNKKKNCEDLQNTAKSKDTAAIVKVQWQQLLLQVTGQATEVLDTALPASADASFWQLWQT